MPTQFFPRLFLLLSGLGLLAFGVVLSIHSNLGTSPISSVPYSFSYIFPLTVGTLTILMHIIMILLQMLILKSRFQWIQWLQLPVGILFGAFIDGLMWLTLGWSIESYPLQLLACLASCLITALGVSLVVKASLVLLAAEGLYQAIAVRYRLDFGNCKTYGDIVLVSIAVISSWLVLHQVIGVREGTIITALLVGTLVKRILPKLSFIQFDPKP
ncbi:MULTISPECIES: YczE/YyaS/YitT family protein [unclassified Acinetobacter]|uniref:YczE/YyaS/YitT family protein n=1 Tax=unclassified Acinetobacter TaxID=196816 RepID=UPI0009C967F5|nr:MULTISPECIES: DUF6198 family protein [unclassified Acinetobacter]OOV79500.1 hypothetical protein B1201_16355 [Acinetobacter sp. ANC 5600]